MFSLTHEQNNTQNLRKHLKYIHLNISMKPRHKLPKCVRKTRLKFTLTESGSTVPNYTQGDGRAASAPGCVRPLGKGRKKDVWHSPVPPSSFLFFLVFIFSRFLFRIYLFVCVSTPSLVILRVRFFSFSLSYHCILYFEK